MDYVPFKEHGLWQCRGFTPSGKHFNRAFRTIREAKKFLSAMRRELIGIERY